MQPIEPEKSLIYNEKEYSYIHEEIIKLTGTHSDLLENLIGEMDAGLYCFDETGRFIYFNKQIATILEYRVEELINLCFFDIIHEDDKERVKESGFSTLQSSDGIISYSLSVVTKSGKKKYARISALRSKINEKSVVFGFAFDTTKNILLSKELERKESQLTQETLFLSALLESSPEAIVVTDAEDNITRINPSFTKTFGYSEQEIKGKNLNSLIAHQRHLKEAINISDDIRKGNTVHFESYRYHKNGFKIPVNILGAPVYINGKLEAIYGIYRDISSQKEYRDELEKSQKELSLLVNNIPGVIYKCANDEFWTMEYLSSKCKDLTGFPSESLINNKIRSFSSIVYEEDVKRLNNNIEEAIRHNHQWEFNYRIKQKDDSLRWVREVGHAVKDSKGQVRYLEGFISDYTEQQKAFQLRKALFNISDATIQSKNPKELYRNIHMLLNDVVDTTNLFIALYQKETDSIQLVYIADEKDTFGEFPAGKTLTGYLIHQGKSMLTNEDEIQQLHDQGHVDLLGTSCESWLGVPLKIGDETIGAIVVQSYEEQTHFTREDQQLLEFVSEHLAIAIQRINYENDLRLAKEKAEESDTLKSSFLANMSHEIRSPMNAILGFAELLKESDLDQEMANEYLNIVIGRSKDLMVLIDEIIDLSKIDAGIFKLNNSDIHINELLQELHAFYQLEKKNRHRSKLDICLDIPDDNDNIILNVDIPRINQVFNNLVINAMKFTENGCIKIGYRVQNQTITFYIEDTGIGIPLEKQSIIFERFRQADESHTREYQGTGLGLSIAKAILEKMGGRIWVKSEQGIGSTFFFSLPLGESLMVPERESDQPYEVKQKVKTTGKILIAEDDLTNYRFLETLLRMKKYECLHASDGIKAIEMVENNDISLILMDVRMPNLDGLEATKILRENGHDIPIIAQTANAMSDDRQLALNAGCSDYLAKPIRKDKLFRLLEKYL